VDVGGFHTRLFGFVYVTCGDFHDGSEREKQELCTKVCTNLGKRAAETLTVTQQAFGDQILSRTQVFQWHAPFKPGRTSVDSDEHTGRASSCTTPETVAQIQELICQDRHQNIHDIAEEVGIGYGMCQRVLTKELGKLWQEQTWLLHHDNAPSHTSILTQQFLAIQKMGVIPHPLHYSDLALCDFFLFPKMKLKLKGRQFDAIEEIQAK
jgi:hypothetical protein